MRRLIIAFVLAIALACGPAQARSGGLDRTAAGEDVTVTMSSPFTDLPPSGCVPYRIDIRNDRSEGGTWHFTAQGGGNGSNMGATVFNKDMTVAPNSSASFDVLVPMAVSGEFGSSMMSLNLSGPGFGRAPHPVFFTYIFSSIPSGSSPFTLIGKEVMGASGVEPLDTAYKAAHREFYGSVSEADKLPEDWRAYSGVASLILKDTEWLGLDAAQRQAVCDYVAQGGRLTIYTSDDVATRTPQLQLPGPGGSAGDFGFGGIDVDPSPVFPPDTSALMALISRHAGRTARNIDDNFSPWNLRASMGTIAVSNGFVLLFVLVFGTLVGPVNLFVFARGKKRFRLFWTTPLISILASLALVVGILCTDGLGGKGRQFIAVFSMPGMNRESVIQEQVVRTAVLFSDHWHSDQNYLITPVSETALHNSIAIPGLRMYRSGLYRGESANRYVQQENDFSGNWFRSRSVSGQYLQAVRPSRASLTVLNPQGLASGSPPVVLSSFPQVLDRVFLVDAGEHYWSCSHLAPGQKQTCVATLNSDFNPFWSEACRDAGGKLRSSLDQARNRPGFFYATGVTPAGDRLTTLDEIHWLPAEGIYLGPWVASTAPETGP